MWLGITYLRKEGRRNLIGVEVCAISECKSLYEYLQTNQEWMLKAALNGKLIIHTEIYRKSIYDFKLMNGRENLAWRKPRNGRSRIMEVA